MDALRRVRVGEGWRGARVVFIVNGREMSWPASAYGDTAGDNRDLALIANACR